MTSSSLRAIGVLFAAVAALSAGCGGSDDDVAVAPAPAPGSAAECFPTLSAVVGTTYQLDYAVSGALTGSSATTGTVSSSVTFNGVSGLITQVQTIRADYTAPALAGSTREEFQLHQAFEGLDIVTHGTTSTTPVDGVGNVTTRAVYTPPVRDKRFTLATGSTQNYTFSVARTTTPPGATNTHSVLNSVTYAGQEIITVPAGTFTTCKFQTNSNGATLTEWLIKGKGVEARSVSTLSPLVRGEVVQELRPSSRVNGAPL